MLQITFIITSYLKYLSYVLLDYRLKPVTPYYTPGNDWSCFHQYWRFYHGESNTVGVTNNRSRVYDVLIVHAISLA